MNSLRYLACGVAAVLASGCTEPVRYHVLWQQGEAEAEVVIHATTLDVAEEVVAGMRDALDAADLKFDPDNPDGGLGRLNAVAAERPYPVDDYDLYRAVRIAMDWARASQGAFDPTAPAQASGDWRQVTLFKEARAVRLRRQGMRIDLAGLREGYAVDMAVRSLAASGTRAGQVRLGDTTYAWERPPGADGWSVALTDPAERDRPLATLTLRSRAVSGAGSLSDQAPPADVLVAFAVADGGVDADAMSTALRVAGSQRAAGLLDDSPRYEAALFVVGPDGVYVLASASLAGRFEVEAELAAAIGSEVRYLLPPQSPP